ncbi:MAG: hypothetical protein K2J99_10665 [Lachnospiraceae bacterium]|nr:hypothetical protein [Lachnospiraceae bacterium]
MRPLRHLAYSTAAASALLVTTKSPKIAMGCVAAGVLVDLDHLIEYKKFCGDDWKWEEFSTGRYFDAKGTVKVIFHSWEAAAVMWGIVLAQDGIRKKNLLYGIAAGYTLHLILDQIGNNMCKMGYFELYRWLVDWKQSRLTADKEKRWKEKEF